MADHRRHAVIAEAAGVEAGRNEARAKRVHLDERRQVSCVAEIVGVGAAREARAGGRLHGDDAHLLAAAERRADERKRDPREVRAAAGAADDDVRIVARHLELGDRFLPDHRLVEQHVVEHRAERVVRIAAPGGNFDGFGDGDAEAARVIGSAVEHGAAGGGFR